MNRPITYKIFKGIKGSWGALNLSLNDAHAFCSNKACKVKNYQDSIQLCDCSNAKMTVREGNLFIELASATGPNVYDWENKVIMALSVEDLGKLIIGLRTGESVSLFHDPAMNTEFAGKKKKILSFSSPKGVKEGGMLRLSENNELADGPKEHTVPLSSSECLILGTLMQAAISRCLGWS